MSQTGKLYNIVGHKIFDDLLSKDGHTGTTQLGFEVLSNNNAVLSIKFFDETMSAYPDSHTDILNFNSITGEFIELQELFNKEGLEHLNNLVNESFYQKIKSNFLETLKDNTLSIDLKNESIESVFALSECAAKNRILKFGITKDALTLEKDQCFPHAGQASDINWESEIKIKSLFSSDFTKYGQHLLSDKISDSTLHYNQKEDYMLLFGKIDNKHSFCFYLWLKYDQIIRGLYWYKNYGNLIDFEGKRVSKNKIEIKEYSGKFDIVLNEDGSISGSWTNNTGTSFPIIFE